MEDDQPLRVLIVDDEAPARDRLRDLIADCSASMSVEIAGDAASSRQALEMLPECDADVALLDIRMPEIDGIELAEHLQKLDAPPAVIFTTAYDAYALKAFEVHAIDYLLKPIRQSRLLDALSRARRMMPLRLEVLREIKPDARSHLSVNERGRIHLIPLPEVVFLKAELKYVTVRTARRRTCSKNRSRALRTNSPDGLCASTATASLRKTPSAGLSAPPMQRASAIGWSCCRMRRRNSLSAAASSISCASSAGSFNRFVNSSSSSSSLETSRLPGLGTMRVLKSTAIHVVFLIPAELPRD